MGIPVCDIFGNNQKREGMTWLCIHPLHTTVHCRISSLSFSQSFSFTHISRNPLYQSPVFMATTSHSTNTMTSSPQHPLIPNQPCTCPPPLPPPPIPRVDLVLIATAIVGECFISRTITSLIKSMPSNPHPAQTVTLLFLAVAGVLGPVFAWDQYVRCDSQTRCWDRRMRDGSKDANDGGGSPIDNVMCVNAVPRKGD